MLRLVVFLGIFLMVSGQTTPVSRCTRNPGDLPLNTYIAGCTNPPCRLPQLQDAVIDIVFQAPRTMTTMRTLATAYLGILPIPYNLGDHADTCNFLENSFCPVIQGEIVRYKLKIYIEPFFPVNTQAVIEFRVVDDNNSAFMCIRVPIHIVPPVEALSGSSA